MNINLHSNGELALGKIFEYKGKYEKQMYFWKKIIFENYLGFKESLPSWLLIHLLIENTKTLETSQRDMSQIVCNGKIGALLSYISPICETASSKEGSIYIMLIIKERV